MDAKTAKNLVLEALRAVSDPELGINLVDLGLVYDVQFGVPVGGGDSLSGESVRVTLGVTSPTCPLGSYLCQTAERSIRAVLPAARSVEVVLSRDPPWSPDRMSPEAREQLGWSP